MGISDADEFTPEERAHESPRVFERVGAKVPHASIPAWSTW
jgi:hypothetical protein